MSKIDEVLEFLASDDNLHSIEEVSEVLNIPRNICEIIANFLAKYDFIILKDLKIKINPKMRDFVITSSNTELTLRIAPFIAKISSPQKR